MDCALKSGLIVALIVFSSSPVRAETLDAGERRTVQVAVITPGQELRFTSVSKFHQAFDQALRAKTDLAASPVEQSFGDCRGDLLCLARGLDRTEQGAVAARPARTSTLTMVISARAANHADLVLVTLLDRACAAELAKRREAPETIADQITSQCVRARSDPRPVAGAEDLERLAIETLEGFASVLRADGAWGAPASIDLEGVPPGTTLQVDERTLGVLAGGQAVITGLRPGMRVVQLSHPSFEPMDHRVRLEAGSTSRLDGALRPLPAPLLSAETVTAFGLIAAGVSLAAYGIVDGGSYQTGCAAIGEASCPSLGFVRLLPRENEDLRNRGAGPLTIPLGYSVAAAGASLLITSAYVRGEDAPPWWVRIAIAAGVGLTLYAASELGNALVTDGP